MNFFSLDKKSTAQTIEKQDTKHTVEGLKSAFEEYFGKKNLKVTQEGRSLYVLKNNESLVSGDPRDLRNQAAWLLPLGGDPNTMLLEVTSSAEDLPYFLESKGFSLLESAEGYVISLEG